MAHWLTRILARSPFPLLIEHQQKVNECVSRLPELVEAALSGDQDRLRKAAKDISVLEHEADQIKTKVRDRLPSTLFLPVSRADLLRVVAAQDSIADTAEDVGVLFTMREMISPPEPVVELLREHVQRVLAVVEGATAVVDRLDRLAKTSFSGTEAQAVLELIDKVEREEHEADKVQDQLAKTFFRHEDAFKPAEIFLWMKIFEAISEVANYAEKLTHRVRLFLAR